MEKKEKEKRNRKQKIKKDKERKNRSREVSLTFSKLVGKNQYGLAHIEDMRTGRVRAASLLDDLCTK